MGEMAALIMRQLSLPGTSSCSACRQESVNAWRVNQSLDIDARRFAAHTPEPMSWAGFAELFSNHWGNVASVLGLVVSVATLAVATKVEEVTGRLKH